MEKIDNDNIKFVEEIVNESSYMISDLSEEEKEKRYNHLREKSISGSSGIRERITEKISVEKFKKALKVLAIAGFICVGAVAYNKVDEIIENYSIIEQTVSDYEDKIITPNSDRAIDPDSIITHYNEEAIAEDLKKCDNFNEALYAIYDKLNEKETNKILGYTEYKNLDTYIEKESYKNIEAWKDYTKKKIILERKNEENEQELEKIEKEYKIDEGHYYNTEENNLEENDSIRR